jgi:preprotein translocase SecF subunit
MIQLLIGTNIPFMRYRRFTYMFSGALILATMVWLVMHGGPRYSIDFTGGNLLQLRTSQVLAADQVRAALDAAGLRGYELQQMTAEHRDEYLIRLPGEGQNQDAFSVIQRAIEGRFNGVKVELRRNERVGPKVGGELRQKALWAVLGSLAGILLYVGIRYEFKFAFGAVVALFHDVFVTLGLLCFTGREVSLTVVAALLTIAGYSINDTIVVFDRIRETVKSGRPGTMQEIMNMSVNEMLGRTFLTSAATLIPTIGLFAFGGPVLRDFAFAILVGVITGTYSSVFIAAPIVLWWSRRGGRDLRSELKRDKQPPVIPV